MAVALKRLVVDAEALLESEEYGAGVRYVCAVTAPALEGFQRAVADLTRGEGTVREL